MAEPMARLQEIGFALLAGFALGVIFFGGLWLTLLRWKRHEGRGPSLWLLGSFFARSAVVLLGLWWVGSGDTLEMLSCAIALLASRWLFIRLTWSPPDASQDPVESERKSQC